MNITKIKNYVATSNVARIRKSVGKFCTRADRLTAHKPEMNGLIPDSMKKCEGTDLTLGEIIALIVRNA